MGLDKEVFSQVSGLIDQIYEANCAVKFMYRCHMREVAKIEAFADPSEKAKATTRAGMLQIGYKLVLLERDELVKRYDETFASPIVNDGESHG